MLEDLQEWVKGTVKSPCVEPASSAASTRWLRGMNAGFTRRMFAGALRGILRGSLARRSRQRPQPIRDARRGVAEQAPSSEALHWPGSSAHRARPRNVQGEIRTGQCHRFEPACADKLDIAFLVTRQARSCAACVPRSRASNTGMKSS